jgi:hypothetical protein
MPIPASAVPYTSDEEDDALYAGPSREDAATSDRNTSQSKDQFGPSGSAKSGDRSAMPVYKSVSADPEEQRLMAPAAPTIDRTGLQAAQSKLTTDEKPISRDDPNYKPKWYERLLGGVAAGLSQNVANGTAIVNRRYNQAVEQQGKQVAQDKDIVGTEQSRVDEQGADFENSIKGFNAQREAVNTNSLVGERAAKADKYDNAIDPQSIHQNDDGSWVGKTYGGKEQETTAPRWAQPKPYVFPKTLPEMYAAIADPKTPQEAIPGLKTAIANMRRDATEQAVNSRAPVQPNEAAQQYSDWKKSFRAQNGREPSADEINTYRRNPASTAIDGKADFKNPAAVDTAESKAFDDAETTFRRAFAGIKADTSLSSADQKKKLDDLTAQHEQKKKGIEDEYNAARAQFNPNRGQIGSAARAGVTPAQPAGNTPAQPAGARQQPIVAPKTGTKLQKGQQVSVKGQLRYVLGYAPNGKVQLSATPPAR